MTRVDNIIVPRWFLEVVEDTLRIQNNINLDKETGESCQDRNIHQSLNGIRKLLNGEELTGMERLEKIQPSLSSDIDEAAERIVVSLVPTFGQKYEDGSYVQGTRDYFSRDELIGLVKAGAEWMEERLKR